MKPKTIVRTKVIIRPPGLFLVYAWTTIFYFLFLLGKPSTYMEKPDWMLDAVLALPACLGVGIMPRRVWGLVVTRMFLLVQIFRATMYLVLFRVVPSFYEAFLNYTTHPYHVTIFSLFVSTVWCAYFFCSKKLIRYVQLLKTDLNTAGGAGIR